VRKSPGNARFFVVRGPKRKAGAERTGVEVVDAEVLAGCFSAPEDLRNGKPQ
jgi:hypothetical protein